MKAGSKIGKYEIIGSIGQGGMADVFKAKDTELGRIVALKLLPPEFARDSERVARFMKEVRNSAAINHPNVVPVYDVGEGDRVYFYTMAYLPGGDLKERIRTGIPADQALDLLKQMAGALGAAHTKGIIHRDVKPENILFDELDRPMLTDLGIARAVSGGTRMTKTGMSIGTPHYMSPEQARGKKVDARSDIYSLGVVFFEMLTGSVPFQAEDTFAVSYMHINDPVPAFPGFLLKYQALINGMLAKDPDCRYPDSKALIADINRVLAGQKALGSGNGPAEKIQQTGQKNVKGTDAVKAVLIGSLCALIAATGVYWYMERNRPMIQSRGGSSALSRTQPPVTMPVPAPAPFAGINSTREAPLATTPVPNDPGSASVPELTPEPIAEPSPIPVPEPAALPLVEPPPVKPAPVPPAKGGLKVSASPQSVTIKIDGKNSGTAPLEIEALEVGTHKVFALLEGYVSQSRVLKIQSGQQAQVYFALKPIIIPGHLTITPTPPDSQVRILNIQPVYREGIELDPGKYHVEVSRDGYVTNTQWVEIGADEEKQIQVTLEEVRKISYKAGQTWKEPVTGMQFVWVPGGCFRMGNTSGGGESDERPVHKVCLDGFWMGKTEVTKGQFRRFVNAQGYLTDAEKRGSAQIYNLSTGWKWRSVAGHNWRNPGFDQSGNHPVVAISWNDAKSFADWLSRKTGHTFKLPTEAQWEYAARAGTSSSRFWGSRSACNYANASDLTPFPEEPKRQHSKRFECNDGFFFYSACE